MSEIKSHIRTLADTLAAEIEISKEGVATVKEGAFERTLEGTGLTLEQAEKASAHIGNLAAATVLAFGEKAVDVVAKNKDLDRISIVLPTTGKDSIKADYFRSKDYPNPKEGGTKTVHGVVTVQAETYGAGNRGQVKAARAVINELALAAAK